MGTKQTMDDVVADEITLLRRSTGRHKYKTRRSKKGGSLVAERGGFMNMKLHHYKFAGETTMVSETPLPEGSVGAFTGSARLERVRKQFGALLNRSGEVSRGNISFSSISSPNARLVESASECAREELTRQLETSNIS